MKKKTTDPQFLENFIFNVPVGVPLLECVIRISVWHQSLLADDTFLGQVNNVCCCCYCCCCYVQVNLSPMEMRKGQLYDLWMVLGPRQELSSSADNGSMRLSVQFKENFIYSSEVYEPLKALLYSSLNMKVSGIS